MGMVCLTRGTHSGYLRLVLGVEPWYSVDKLECVGIRAGAGRCVSFLQTRRPDARGTISKPSTKTVGPEETLAYPLLTKENLLST